MFCSAACSPVNQEQACGRKGCGPGNPSVERNSISTAERWIPRRLSQAGHWLRARRSCLYLSCKMITISWYLKKCWNESRSLSGSLDFCIICCLSASFLPHLSFSLSNNPFPCLLCILVLCLCSPGKLRVVLWQNPCYSMSQ